MSPGTEECQRKLCIGKKLGGDGGRVVGLSGKRSIFQPEADERKKISTPKRK